MSRAIAWGWGLLALSAGLACQPEETLRQSSCAGCHRPDGEGIEIPHARFALRCVDCHGGDPEAETVQGAHVPNPMMLQVVEDLSAQEMYQLDQDYLRFLNPAHPAAVTRSCGSESPQGAAGAGCHQAIIDTTELSVHATSVGIVNIPQFDRGLQPTRPPRLSVVATRNESFQASTAPRFTYAGLDALAVETLEGATPADPRPYYANFQAKQCARCHLHVYGGGAEPGRDGLYRGVGCAACHMPYGHDGLSDSAGPSIDKSTPAHAEKHQLVRLPPTRACEACHNRSNRIGLQYKGWREVAEGEQDTLQRAQLTTRTEYGRPPGAYAIDEDTRNEVDETPPDVHQVAGMGCVDCHVGVDVHGDGNIRPNMGTEVGIECVDCHGGFDAPATEQMGVFRTTGGSRLERLRRADDGRVVLELASSGEVLEVPQTPDLANARAIGAHDAASHGELECYACHTAWMQNVLRVERVLDLRERAEDPVEGLRTPGLPSERVALTTLDDFLLGLNVDGKVGPYVAEHAPFTVIAPCDPGTTTATCTEDADSAAPGRRVVDGWLGQSSEGRIALAFRPSFPHTVGGAGAVKACEACHLGPGGDLDAVRAVYGFGSGEHLYTEPRSGRTVDLLQMIDASGTSTTALGTLLATPLPPERIQRALDAAIP